MAGRIAKRMMMGGSGDDTVEDLTPPEDPTGWLVDNGLADFLSLHSNEIKYMCMFGYTFYHGSKVFSSLPPGAPFSFKFVSMILACTGGGILVPIFVNAVPVPLSTDAYPIAILASFVLHDNFPILRDILKLSPIFKGIIIFLYETLRASVVVKLTLAAGKAIPSSEFSFPVFGPIFCGAIAGCGGAFLPLNKGLEPLKGGLAPNMMSALIAATFFHLFMSTSLSDGVVDAKKKAHVIVAAFFVAFGFSQAFNLSIPIPFLSSSTNTTAAKEDAEKKEK